MTLVVHVAPASVAAEQEQGSTRAPGEAGPRAHSARPLKAWPADAAAAWWTSFSHWSQQASEAIEAEALHLRGQLRAADLSTSAGAGALGFVAAALKATSGWTAYDEQGLAAWLMLQGRLVEMATGEGKTLAAGLAAATAALAGLSVHVLTANDYLVQRDHASMEALFRLLGLSSAKVVGASTRAQRLAAYRQSIVYVTGRELVFDHLKDHLQLQGRRDPRLLRARSMSTDAQAGMGEAVLPRLQQAIIDEADAILLDEACIPFILSMPGAAPDAAPLEAARVLARSLGPADYLLLPSRRHAELTASGRDHIARVLHPASPLWPARHAFELVRAALVAEHLLKRDRDYAVGGQGILLIDEITGRIAQGRQWNEPLHAMVELKEGRKPSPAMRTAARITYQRFFPRYERLGGMSGTLRESAAELHALYRCRVVPLPLIKPSRARWEGRRIYRDEESRRRAVVSSVSRLAGTGRPVLVGTDSVLASQALSQALHAQGIAHQVLNAVQDMEEAARVAMAGQAGRVTVTTNMAGRGTDIRLDGAARAAGGLHVILALTNRARRIDRQLAGRSARHGDPGSAEALISLEDAVIVQSLPRRLRLGLAALADVEGRLPDWVAPCLLAWSQQRAEWRERMTRRDLKLLDDGLADLYAFAGGTE